MLLLAQLQPVISDIKDRVDAQVVLPEGAKPRGVQTAFEVDKGAGKKFTYLDTHGRPVILLHRTNIGIEHMVAYTVQYTFSTFSLVRPSTQSLKETYCIPTSWSF